ncbi:MAG: DNA gyrase subunit A, partial [Actinomycetota bacterium]|nr:DNA gyrase subunit A [Actinomycetota bacterium]
IATTTTHHWLLFFTTLGKVYRVKAYHVPEGSRTSRGVYAANLPGVSLSGDEKVAAVIPLKDYDDAKYVVFATRNGIVKKTLLSEYDSPRSGLAAINLRDGDRLIAVHLTDGGDDILLVSRGGLAIRFREELARPMGRATGGVIGMRLADGDEVIAMALASQGEAVVTIAENGLGKRTLIGEYPRKGRGTRGVITHKLTSRTGKLAGAFVGSQDQDVFVISTGGIVIRVPSKSIRRTGRPSQGVRVIKLAGDMRVAAVAPVIEHDTDVPDPDA